MASTRWQRLGPFLDVLGAVLIFGSWIASNTLSQRAHKQTESHQAMVDRVRQFRLYEDFAHRIREVQSELARIHHLVEDASRKAQSLADPSDSSPEAFTWTGMTAPQVREVNDFIDDLEHYAAPLPVSQDRSRSLTAAREGVEAMSVAFGSARVDYEQLITQPDDSASSPSSSRQADSESQLEQQIDRLWKQYDSAKRNMLEVGDHLLREASAAAESASALANKSKRLSWILYVLGTLIILAGRAGKVLGVKAAGAG